MIFEKVRAMIANNLSVEESEITMDSRLVEDLKADSIDSVGLILDIEREFDIQVPDESLEQVKTVADIVKFVEQAKN
ncbi:MAG: acyl carrier protein [Christensenellales bacterium]|jgi:acyl carrier protein